MTLQLAPGSSITRVRTRNRVRDAQSEMLLLPGRPGCSLFTTITLLHPSSSCPGCSIARRASFHSIPVRDTPAQRHDNTVMSVKDRNASSPFQSKAMAEQRIDLC
eukprot:3926589-Rhodomonas_salina.3